MVCAYTLVACVAAARAQARNEVAFSIGAVLPPDPGSISTLQPPQPVRVAFGSGLTFEANYARRLLTREHYSLELETPLLAVPSESVRSRPGQDVPGNFASLFITPSLRVRLLPQHRLSVWGSLGGGYADYAESTHLQSGAVNRFARGTSGAALQYGVGADYRLLTLFVPVSLRVEARDLYAADPSLNLQLPGTGHHDPFVTGGFVLHF